MERNHKCFFNWYFQVDVVESFRSKSSKTNISCAKILRSNIKLFKYLLEVSVGDTNDVASCQSNLVVPDSLDIFMKHLRLQR